MEVVKRERERETDWQLQRSMHLTMSSNKVGDLNTLPTKLLSFFFFFFFFFFSLLYIFRNSLTALSSSSDKRSIRDT